jgi:RHS repeat-associated protein
MPMRLRKVFFACATPWVITGAALAQSPVLGSIETPYPAIQSSIPIHLAGHTYGSGAVTYGPWETPLVLTGSGLGTDGTVNFYAYQNGAVVNTVRVTTATLWQSSMIFVQVPSGAGPGLVTVTVNGTESNALPFVVTTGTYSASCPAEPSDNEFQITTASLYNGIVSHTYSATLGATGGRQPYVWSLPNGRLPAGLSLSASGVISGTPAVPGGPTSFTVQAVDQDQEVTQALLDITVQAPTMQSGVVYSYAVPSEGYDGAGNLLAYNDSIMGYWWFAYDSLNRLAVGNATTGDHAGQYACWSYDNFGNRTQQVMSSQQFQSGSGGLAACQLQVTAALLGSDLADYNANNRIVSTNASGGVALPLYDGAGNMTYDGANYYSYDGDGRVCAVQTYSFSGYWSAYGYVYDAEGKRIAKGTVTPSASPATQPISCDPGSNGFQLTESYVLGPNGENLSMEDGGGNWQRTNVYAAGKLIGTYDLVPNPSYPQTQPQLIPGLHFHLTDPLGSHRVQVAGELANLGVPESYFENQQSTALYSAGPSSSDDATLLHFTGKERDAESGNDYFGARYYSSASGRFTSPDTSDSGGPIPYADLEDPQSLNL